MDRVELEVFSQASNQAVVRMPGRRFPGIVIQGDTLSGLVADATELVTQMRAGNQPLDEAAYLSDQLAALLSHYAQTLTAHGIELPYVPDA